MQRLSGYKPVPVPLRAAVIHLGRPLLNGSSDLPGSSKGRAAPPPLFGLAPRGVCPAGEIALAAVRSYRTISPLPGLRARKPAIRAVYFLWHFPSGSCEPARPLAGTLPCGDRTFLPRTDARAPETRATARPTASLVHCRMDGIVPSTSDLCTL